MRIIQSIVLAGVMLMPVAALAQNGASTGPAQPRDGMGDSTTPSTSFNGLPAGSVNAATGPQAHPAYPSGSTTANPGAAFVRDQPVPSTSPLTHSPGELSTTATNAAGTKTQSPASPGVGEAARPPGRP